MGFVGFTCRQAFAKPRAVSASITLSDQTAIITGANVGLGLATARDLLAHDLSRLILSVRSLPKGEAARDDLLKTYPNATIEVWELDYENFACITAFGERAKALDRLDIVILSAGVKKLSYAASPTGHEASVQVNHLGTALLSLLLLPKLKATAKATGKPSRLTIVTSEVHMWATFKEQSAPNIIKAMDEKSSFSAPERYHATKLLNVLWARELAEKVAGEEVIINTVNPGLCMSELHREETSAGFKGFASIFGWSCQQGGWTLVDAAVAKGRESHGGYLSEQKMVP
jgi:retinol dehydrogenase 12